MERTEPNVLPLPDLLDPLEESPYLRRQKSVPIRRSRFSRRVRLAIFAVAILLPAGIAGYAIATFALTSPLFVLNSADDVVVAGNHFVSRDEVVGALGLPASGTLTHGPNIFRLSLDNERRGVETLPWVHSASVTRILPHGLYVNITERTPVAFARVGPKIFLIDGGGTLMDLPPKHRYSYPVILGMNPGEPISTRLPRMKAYNELVDELDSGGAHYSKDLSEVDVSDLDDVKVRVNDPQGDVLVELGSSDYLKRYRTYVSHVQEWRQQFQKLESVNLRYDNQVIVNPDMEGKPKPAALTLASAKAAAAAGVKPAALITKLNPHDKTIPKPAFELTDKKLDPKAATKKPTPKARAKKTAATVTKASAPKKDVATHSPAPKGKAAHATAQKTAVKKSAQFSPVVAANGVSAKPSAAVAKPSAGSN